MRKTKLRHPVLRAQAPPIVRFSGPSGGRKRDVDARGDPKYGLPCCKTTDVTPFLPKTFRRPRQASPDAARPRGARRHGTCRTGPARATAKRANLVLRSTWCPAVGRRSPRATSRGARRYDGGRAALGAKPAAATSSTGRRGPCDQAEPAAARPPSSQRRRGCKCRRLLHLGVDVNARTRVARRRACPHV